MDSHQELYLPLDIVTSSPGFSFDIGSSLMKIIYRSKADFIYGTPKNKEAVKNGKGRVYMVSIARNLGPAVLTDVILNKSDVSKSTNERLVVPVTGVGANLLQKDFEEKLNVQLQILMEDACLSDGFKILLENSSGSELEYPVTEQDREAGQAVTDMFNAWTASSGMTPEENFSMLTNLGHQLPDRDKLSRPCLLVCCGSLSIIMLINEEGKMITTEGVFLAGKTLMNFVSHILGKQGADGATCDVTMGELVNPESEGNYGNMKGSEMILFYMGKLDQLDADEVKKADLARSLFRLGCQNLGQMAIIHALAFGVRRVYFTGSFVSIPLARKFITAEIEGRNNMKPKKSLIPSHYIFAAGQRSYWKNPLLVATEVRTVGERALRILLEGFLVTSHNKVVAKNQRVEYHFVRHVGYCGAIGAFAQGKK